MVLVGQIDIEFGSGGITARYTSRTLACSMSLSPPMPGTVDLRLPVNMLLAGRQRVWVALLASRRELELLLAVRGTSNIAATLGYSDVLENRPRHEI